MTRHTGPAGGEAVQAALDGPERVLLVDDRPEQLAAVGSILEDLGTRVDTAQSGREALRLLLRHDYAVILLDVNMPRMDGFETAALIRQRPASEATPIIFMTADTPSGDELSRGYRLGAVDYLFTPVVPGILRAKVAVFIDLHRKSAQIRQQAEWVAAEADRRARSLETRLRYLLDDLTIGVFRALPAGVDGEGRLVEANPAFLDLLGVEDLEEASGLGLAPVFRLEEGLHALGSGGGALRDQEVELRRADGGTLWVRMQRRISYTAQGEVFLEGLMDDITERKRGAEALARKAEELVRTNAELEHFAYMASHDLQEPLRTISLYVGMVERQLGEAVGDPVRSWLGRVRRASVEMQQLVRDVLSFSRTRAREAALREVACDELVDRALFNLELSVRESQAHITRDPLPTLRVDPVLAVHLFQNLLGNALKYRRGPEPRIHVGAELRGDHWELSVADDGIGIAPGCHDEVFGIFRRLHTGGRIEGSGMGLAICKHIVERHGGRIWCESEPGRGTTFRFTLPAGGADTGS